MFPASLKPLRSAIALLISLPCILAASNGTVVPLKATVYGTSYGVDVQLGGQTITMLADTGSADLWALDPGWQCLSVSATGNVSSAPRSKCSLGNETYRQTSTFHSIDNAWLDEVYGAGVISGPLGYEDVQIGSLSIPQQEFGVVNATSIHADGYLSGLLGLAYPVLGQAHPTNFTASAPLQFFEDRIAYPTVLKRLTSMGISYFSMALERLPVNQEAGFGGYLGFGKLPPVSYGAFVTVPVEITKDTPLLISNGTQQISYWSLTVDTVTWAGKTVNQPFQAVLDSGNWINFLPNNITAAVNAAFDPPAKLDANLGQYSVNCNATPPASFALQLGGYQFSIDSADMIWRDPTGACWSSVAPLVSGLGSDLSILGDAFLKNVVAVFDYGQNEMRFAPRLADTSSSGIPMPSTGGAALNSELRLSVVVLACSMAMMILF